MFKGIGDYLDRKKRNLVRSVNKEGLIKEKVLIFIKDLFKDLNFELIEINTSYSGKEEKLTIKTNNKSLANELIYAKNNLKRFLEKSNFKIREIVIY